MMQDQGHADKAGGGGFVLGRFLRGGVLTLRAFSPPEKLPGPVTPERISYDTGVGRVLYGYFASF